MEEVVLVAQQDIGMMDLMKVDHHLERLVEMMEGLKALMMGSEVEAVAGVEDVVDGKSVEEEGEDSVDLASGTKKGIGQVDEVEVAY